MPKSTDVPNELKQFNKIFERFEHRWDSSTVFDDYLTYCIEVFKMERTGEPVRQLQEKYGEDYFILVELFHEHAKVMNLMVAEDGMWYDLLGSFYECLRSNGKASALGQFFTPKTVCDFMAQVTIDETLKGAWKRINDCACGSGRTLLAANNIAPGNFLYGEDLDPMCAKMCAINMVLHACVGQVCCMNTLIPDRWYFGYDINPELYSTGRVGLRPVEKEKAFSYMSLHERIVAKAENKPEPENKIINVGKAIQLNLFE